MVAKVGAKEGTTIIGIDPGTTVMGYGIIRSVGKDLEILRYGVLHLHKYPDHATKLEKIFSRVVELMVEYNPNVMAIEAPFFGKNVQAMLKLGRAQGVAIAAAISKGVPVVEYMPTSIKQAVTGNGRASKQQVAAMLVHQLDFDHGHELHDETDALAVAVCHHYSGHAGAGISVRKKSSDWGAFVSQNAHRVKKN